MLENDTNRNVNLAPYYGDAATQRAFETFSSSICQKSFYDTAGVSVFPTQETIEVCDGKPYRKCYLPGNTSGICYSTRIQVLACLPDKDYIELPRTEIKRGVGQECDPTEEKWLGCSE